MYFKSFLERSKKENNSFLNKILKKNYCIVCNHFSNFQRVSKRKIELKRRCKICFSLARHRMLINYLKNNRKLIHGKRILEISPSPCTQYYFDTNKEIQSYETLDIQDFNRENHHAVDLEKDDLSHIKSVDLIINFHVMEHLRTDFTKVIFKLNGLLNKNGTHLLCMPTQIEDVYEFNIDPIADEERQRLFGHKYHYLKIGEKNLLNILKKKFIFKTVEKKNYVSNYFKRNFGKKDEEFEKLKKKRTYFYAIYKNL
ncbi:hypothetical protein OAR82_02290 [Candidatus Pelagibacter sp.]|nr:hypothetical protein [Candidatus Pelagibacter sp.]